MSQTAQVPAELLDRVVAYFHPRRVILFGSQARGEAAVGLGDSAEGEQAGGAVVGVVEGLHGGAQVLDREVAVGAEFGQIAFVVGYRAL